MSIESYFLAAFAVLLTGISKSGFAGGLGILGVPLLSVTMSPQAAATILLPILLSIDLLSVWRYRTAWRAQTIVILLPGAMIGIGIGMASFAHIDADLLKLVIGVMALAFVANFARTAGQLKKLKASGAAVLLVSVLSGFAGFIAHAGGPPIKGVFLRMGLDKSAFVGTNAVFFLTLNLVKTIGYTLLGLFSQTTLVASASLVPFLVLGVAAGFALHDRVPQAMFVRLAYGLLALAGINLIVVGAAAVWTI